MPHDYDGAVWAEHHRLVTAGIAHLLEALHEAFECLVAIEFDAPWERARY